MSLDQIIGPVEAELHRRRSRNLKVTPKVPTASHVKANSINGNESHRTKKKVGPCFICGRIGHFARECYYRHTGNSGRGRGRCNSRGRGYRGGRGRGRRSGNSDSHRNVPNHGTIPSYLSNRDEGQTQNRHLPFQQNIPNRVNVSHQTEGQGPSNVPPNSNTPGMYQPYGFMPKVKYRSSAASCAEKKSNVCLIDSGASDHFFFSRKAFTSYEELSSRTVKAAVGTSNIVGKGMVKLPLENGIIVEVFHLPQFSTNIISVGNLSSSYNTLFTTRGNDENTEAICEISLKNSGIVIHTVAQENGLYAIPVRPENQKDIIMAIDEDKTSGTICKSSYRSNGTLQEEALEWHRKLCHPSPARYLKAAAMYEDVPQFSKSTLNNILCIPCQVGRAKRAPISRSTRIVQEALELVHLDISGRLTSTLGSNEYFLGIIDDFSPKSDIYFLKHKSDLLDSLMFYKNHSEKVTGYPLINIRLDGAGENSSEEVKLFCIRNGIRLEYSPRYAPESNGIAESLMQELGTRSRVMLLSGKMEKTLWGEAMHHGNRLRNRLPSDRIGGDIPILKWNPNTQIKLGSLPEFGENSFAFVYRPGTARHKKFLLRSIHGQFVGMESDTSLFRIYVPYMKKILKVRTHYFRVCKSEQLPGISSLLDGIARQSELEVEPEDEYFAEDVLAQAFQAFTIPLRDALSCASSKRTHVDHRIPKSFMEALHSKNWRDAIDRELQGLVRQGTWRYVEREPGMNPIPITWNFRLKPLDKSGTKHSTKHLHKARCVVRGDLQRPGVDFNPENLYAAVALHVSIRTIIALAAGRRLIIEGADISYAYLHGKIDVPIIIVQPRDSRNEELHPGKVCLLLKSMYGLKQAGSIWGSTLIVQIIAWGFKQLSNDTPVLVKGFKKSFVIIAIVVDDMLIVSNSAFDGVFESKARRDF